jgi:ABC-2 type transport system permease protein
MIFEILTETVAWERWEGTIEYTFMAPLSRAVHLLGMGAFAVLYGVVRTALLFAVVALFFGLSLDDANFAAALVVLAVASLSFVGIGMVTAVLPLISPEKGEQLGFVAQGLLLVVSGVYYPVEVMPGWMQGLATLSPATYALDGMRDAVLDGAGVAAVADDLWPLLGHGVVAILPVCWSFAPASGTPSAAASSSAAAESPAGGPPARRIGRNRIGPIDRPIGPLRFSG